MTSPPCSTCHHSSRRPRPISRDSRSTSRSTEATGGWLAEPDLSLAEAKIALEYQGADHAEVRRMRKDIARSTDMRRDRWVVIEYRPAEVFGRPQLIAPELRSLVRERAPHLLGLRPRRRLVT